jgi:cell pole-organizing protein PopZ
MAQAAKTPGRLIDLVAAVRLIFDEDEVDKSAQNHSESIGFDSAPDQSSAPTTAAPDQELGSCPECLISDAVASDQSSPAPQAAGSTSMYDMPIGEERGFVLKETTAATHSAFNALAQTVLVENAGALEDLVAQTLPALLKTWLNDNLPNMVERLLRAEIQRASRSQ